MELAKKETNSVAQAEILWRKERLQHKIITLSNELLQLKHLVEDINAGNKI